MAFGTDVSDGSEAVGVLIAISYFNSAPGGTAAENASVCWCIFSPAARFK